MTWNAIAFQHTALGGVGGMSVQLLAWEPHLCFALLLDQRECLPLSLSFPISK